MIASASSSFSSPRLKKLALAMTVLVALTLVAAALYQFAFVNPKFFSYAMELRAPRLIVMLTAGLSLSAARRASAGVAARGALLVAVGRGG